MEEAMHTPGEWYAAEWTCRAAITVLVDDPTAGILGKRIVAECETEDDARLIAASKELLEACQAIAAWDEAEKNAKPYDEDGGAGFYQRIAMCTEAFAKARAAIAKATALPA